MNNPADCTVGFARIGHQGRALLGSGTLVATPNQRAIVTAGSVLARLAKQGRLGIVLRTDLNQISLDTANLTYQPISAAGMPLGLIRLPNEASRRFEETKRFADLSLAVHEHASDARGSTWLISGFSSELTTTQLPLDCFDMVLGYTNVTGVPVGDIIGSDADVKLEVRGVSETGAGLSLEGIVGGGLWRVRSKVPKGTAILSGIVISAPEAKYTSGTVRCVGSEVLAQISSALDNRNGGP